MPNSAVYQPTTVTYEQQPSEPRWTCPITFFSHHLSCSLTWFLASQLAMSSLAGVTLLSGVGMVVAGSIQYHITEDPETAELAVHVIIAGGVVFVLGILCTCWCTMKWPSKMNINKDLPCNGVATLNGLNPSTDPLVAAQYAPVRDAPPVPDDEMHNLMDSKDCMSSAEESDKMLDGRASMA